MQKIKGKTEYLYPLLFGFIISALLIVPAIIRGGGILYLTNDFSTQQLPFYVLCHDAVKSGSLYSHLTGLGSSVIGSYSFYALGSPFFWMTVPFDSSIIPYLMGPLLIIKFTLSALTSYIFIRPYLKCKDSALLGSVLYAFSGYQIFNIFYNHFEDVCVVAPLLLWALDRLMEDKYRGVFCLAVMVNASINYVFFVGTVVFVIIYFILMTAAGQYKLNVKRVMRIAFEAVLGLLLAGILIIPSVIYLLGNSRISNTIGGINLLVYSSPQRYWEIFRSMIIPPDTPHISPFIVKRSGTVWNSPAMYIPLFGISAACGIFFEKGHKFFKMFALFMPVIMFVPAFNSVFSALNSTYYARWYYYPVLILSLLTAYTVDNEDMKKSTVKGGYISLIAVTLFSLICIFCPKADNNGDLVFGLFNKNDIAHTLFYISLTVISLGVMIFLLKSDIKYKYIKKLLIVFSAVNILLYGTINITTLCSCYDNSDTYKETFIDGMELLQDGVDNYRIDTTQIHYNAHMWWDKQSIATFNSTISASEVDYYNTVGYSRYVATMPSEAHYGTRYLTSVRYAFYDKDDYCILPEFVPIGSYNGYLAYENPYYIPMGFYYNNYISLSELEKYPNLSVENLILKGILLDDGQIKKYSSMLGHIDLSSIHAGTLTAVSAAEDAAALSGHGGKSFKWLENGFISEVNLRTDNLVFYSVPYDSGFTAYIDGVKTEIEKVNIGFMAVAVPKGNHTVEFKYETPGLDLGVKVSTAALCVFTLYMIYAVSVYFIEKRKKSKTV